MDFFGALSGARPLPIYIQNHEKMGPRPARPRLPHAAELLARLSGRSTACGTSRKRRQHRLQDRQDPGAGRRRLLGHHGRQGGALPAGRVPPRGLRDDARLREHGRPRPPVERPRRREGGRGPAPLQGAPPPPQLRSGFGTAVYKEVLYRRRIIASPTKRLPGPTLDAYDHQELDRILAELAPQFLGPDPHHPPRVASSPTTPPADRSGDGDRLPAGGGGLAGFHHRHHGRACAVETGGGAPSAMLRAKAFHSASMALSPSTGTAS